MAILSVVVLIGLLAAPAISAPVKGGLQERAEEQRASGVKGDLGRQLPVDYSQKPQQRYEQRVQVAYAAKGQPETFASEQAKLADSDLYQQREEAKSDRQQIYETQTQLRERVDSKQDSSRRTATKSEERVEEQTKFDDFPQQVEESPAHPVKGYNKPDYRPDAARTNQETKQQVREEVAAPVFLSSPAKAPARVEQAAVSKPEERREEQVQYTAQAPEEPQQQQVDLTRDFEQRRYEVQTEVRQEAEAGAVSQVREELLEKGGLRAPAAEAEPYAFEYQVEGSSRRESGDQHGVVRGQYTLQNPDGTQRVVNYVADQDGFRAQVRTNEFGTEGHQQHQQAAARVAAPVLEGKTSYQQVDLARVAVAPAAPIAVKSAAVPRPAIYQEERSAASGVFKVEPAAKGPVELGAAVVVPEPEAQVQRVATVDTIKSAELRSPKAIGARSGPIVTRASGFESATAHHQHHNQLPVVRSHPVPVSVPVVAVRHQPVPVVPVVRHQVLTPLRSHHLASGYQHNFRQYHAQPVAVHGGVLRAHSQHDHYRPVSHRRDQPAHPRVSFYANHDDEQPAGFEYPADLI